MNWPCPVTGGLPTRMSYDGFVAACRARRGRAGCDEWCGGMPPPEMEILDTEWMMGKSVKDQIAEALAPVKAELEDREARVAVLEDTLAGTEEALAGAKARIAELEADRVKMMDLIQSQQTELTALRAAEAEPAGITGVDVLDMSANLYRDALADFAIRVLSGGVAVSFREPTA